VVRPQLLILKNLPHYSINMGNMGNPAMEPPGVWTHGPRILIKNLPRQKFQPLAEMAD
jgi:hypothetical protein